MHSIFNRISSMWLRIKSFLRSSFSHFPVLNAWFFTAVIRWFTCGSMWCNLNRKATLTQYIRFYRSKWSIPKVIYLLLRYYGFSFMVCVYKIWSDTLLNLMSYQGSILWVSRRIHSEIVQTYTEFDPTVVFPTLNISKLVCNSANILDA